MIEYIETLLTGQYKILFWFIAAIVFIYIPLMWLYLKRRKQKGLDYAHRHRDAVKVYYDVDLTGTLTVCGVDGSKPVFFFEGLRQGFYLLPGTHKIEVHYYWNERSLFTLSGYKDYNIGPEELDVQVEKHRAYSLGYDIQKGEFRFGLKQ